MEHFARLNGGEPVRAEAALRKGPWTVEEDIVLMSYIALNGDGGWNNLARAAGLNRTGKSCRLRWLNYLRPGVRRGNFSAEEHALVVELQSRWGNKWSKIARHLPGRTDNEVKNYWRTKILKKRRPCSEADAAVVAGSGATELVGTAESDSQTSTNASPESISVRSVHVAAEPSMLCWDHRQSFFVANGGGDGALMALPELVTESSDNFSWTFEEIWPAPMHSFNFSF